MAKNTSDLKYILIRPSHFAFAINCYVLDQRVTWYTCFIPGLGPLSELEQDLVIWLTQEELYCSVQKCAVATGREHS